MLAPQRTMEIALQIDYSGISSSRRKRYAEMLVARAVRFYIDNELDSSVVSEDLYQECKFCEYEYPDHKEEGCKMPLFIFPNLIYNEKEEAKYQRGLSKLLKG